MRITWSCDLSLVRFSFTKPFEKLIDNFNQQAFRSLAKQLMLRAKLDKNIAVVKEEFEDHLLVLMHQCCLQCSYYNSTSLSSSLFPWPPPIADPNHQKISTSAAGQTLSLQLSYSKNFRNFSIDQSRIYSIIFWIYCLRGIFFSWWVRCAYNLYSYTLYFAATFGDFIMFLFQLPH